MSSSTSDSFVNHPVVNIITGFLSNMQQRRYFSRENFLSTRQIFFRTIGFFVLLYGCLHMLISLYLVLKFIFNYLFQFCSMFILLPLKFTQLILPKTSIYYLFLPLILSCSLISFVIAKLSHKNIANHIGKHNRMIKRHSFYVTFIIILLCQSGFILLHMAHTIGEQRNLSLTPATIKPSIMKLTEDRIRETILQANSIIRNLKRELTEDKSHSEEIGMTDFLSKTYSRHDQAVKIESNVEDDLAHIADQRMRSLAKDIVPSEGGNSLKQAFVYSNNSEPQWAHTSNEEPSDMAWHVSSIYAAYTDLNCFDYTKAMHRYHSVKGKFIHFLDIYRRQSPFPIYVSILRSKGPQCYSQYRNTFCAIRSIEVLPSASTERVSFFKRHSFIFCNPIIIFIIIYKIIKYRFYRNTNQSTLQTIPKTTNNISMQQAPTSTNKTPLDRRLENDLRTWLELEQNDGYQYLSETCRTAMNETFSRNPDEQLNIETLQFANAKIHDISQTSTQIIVINAILDIIHLIFNIVNVTKCQHYSIEISNLTGELEIFVTSSLNQYSIEVKFRQIHIDGAHIIDSKNVLSSSEKQSIISLIEETIRQTSVQCRCQLTEYQDYMNNTESSKQSSTISNASASPRIIEPCETPILTKTNINHQPLAPLEEGRKLLVRIVKAVKLHDVEQPFCLIELNQPRQTFETSIAKNGLNPFWDECFVFETNKKSNRIRLKIIDRKKANKKHNGPIDIIYADVLIPLSYVTSQAYKQDVPITPQHPDSIIRIEFSSISDEESLSINNGCDIDSITDSLNWPNSRREATNTEHGYPRSPSDEIAALQYNGNVSLKNNRYSNNISNTLPRPTTLSTALDSFVPISNLPPFDNENRRKKVQKSHSFMSTFRKSIFSRRKKHDDHDQQHNQTAPLNTTIQSGFLPYSSSTEPYQSLPTASRTNFHRQNSITRSFRNMFRSKINKQSLDASTITAEPRDSVSTSTPTPKKRSFFQRFKSERKQPRNLSINSLTSEDCTRSESARNTPIRANVGRPVTMNIPTVQS